MKYVASLVPLLAAFALGQSWVVEQVDSTAAAGSPVELVKAADGRLWAGYGTRSGAARVACLGDSGWSFTDVCSSAALPGTSYRPFLAASHHGELCLACYDSTAGNNRLYRMVGDTWRSEPSPFNFDSLLTNTVAYDTSGRLYVVFEPRLAEFWVGHETDSGWTKSFVVQLPVRLYNEGPVGYLAAAADGSPWFFGFCGYDDGPLPAHGTDLLHFTGDSWVSAWHVYSSEFAPIPLALAPHGNGVGNLTWYGGFIQYDSERVAPFYYSTQVAGLTYTTDDVPLVACAPSYGAARPFFAFKTNRWHTESIPGPAGIGGIDIEVDTLGQVIIVYSTQDSGLWCARAMVSDVVGVKESSKPKAASVKPVPTIVRGVLMLGAVDSRQQTVGRGAPSDGGRRGQLLDAAGRSVVELYSGANDVSRLAPGVYFVREAQAQAGRNAAAVTKVVITK
ncbi:MAG TPA: hypothetical protein VMH22_07025 [bacterium]|nr:hypothetical protein [bacterium]